MTYLPLFHVSDLHESSQFGFTGNYLGKTHVPRLLNFKIDPRDDVIGFSVRPSRTLNPTQVNVNISQIRTTQQEIDS